MKMNAVIIDDEPDAIEILERILGSSFPEISVLDTATTINGGVEIIEKHRPELVFLDVEMPGGTGFDVLKRTQNNKFSTIFISAHENYAIEAVKFHALAYLLKPVDIEELENTINKLIRASFNQLDASYKALLNTVGQLHPQKIAIPTGSGYRYFEADNVIRIEAERNYSNVHVDTERKPILVSRNLKQFELLFARYGFLRVHNTHLINPRHIKEYIKRDGGSIRITGGQELFIGPNFRKTVVNYLNSNTEGFS